ASQTGTRTLSAPAAVLANSAAPADGKLTGDVTFNIKIGNETAIPIQVKQSSTTDNVKLGNDKPKLVDADKSPTFGDVDDLVYRVFDILGSSNPLTYNQNDHTLLLTLSLGGTFGTLDLPLDFNLDLAPLLELSSNSILRLSADGSLSLTLGVFLADAPASTLLTGSEKLKDELNGGIDVKPEQVITGKDDVKVVYGRLSGPD